MSWQLYLEAAEAMLDAARVPSSLEIITLIKKVNPTKLCLSDPERERGYEVKGRLQNLLLEQYGGAFHLAPHPCSSNIVLIKHATLPSVDACHAELAALSSKALDSVAVKAVSYLEKKERNPGKRNVKGEAVGCCPKEALRKAQQLLDRYEYPAAEEELAAIRIARVDDLPALEKAVRLLVEEMGAYGRAIETLLAQPKQVLKEKEVREQLAVAYYRNGCFPEARVLLEAFHPDELGKSTLCAWADIAFRDDNLRLAWQLLQIAEHKEGFVSELALLRAEIEGRLLAEADPLLQRALAAREQGELEEAAALAREALRLCPGHEVARDIVGLREADREAAEIAALWAQLEQKTEGRLELLARLLEKDRGNGAKIEGLIAEEKARRKKEWGDSRLEALRTLTREEKWRECYDIIDWLSRQDDLAAEYRTACGFSPYFALLHQNRALQKLSPRSAKECWLEFVEAVGALRSGQPEASLQIMERIKGYFLPYPEFAAQYQSLLRDEQQRARGEISHLLELLNGEKCTLPQGERLAGQLRKRMVVLPEEERRGHQESIDRRLGLLRPVQSEASLLRQYSQARYLGLADKAALLREQIGDSMAIARVDARCARDMKVEVEPLTLAFSSDLDRVKLIQKPNLWLQWHTDRHMIFDDGHWRVVVNLEEMSATRYRFPHIGKPTFCDALPGQNTFLVKDGRKTGRGVWRVVLSGGRGEVTAILDALALDKEKDCMAVCTFLCSERPTDYYTLMVDAAPAQPFRAVRQRITTKKAVGDGVEIDPEAGPYFHRLTAEPDRFIIGWKDETRICNKNLTTESAVQMTPIIWEVDQVNERIYYFYSHLMKKVDFRFEHYEEFPKSQYSFFFKEHHKIMGIRPETDTMLVGLCNRGAFYDFRNHRISEPFRLGRVICTRPVGRWYSFDYDARGGKLTLIDITDAIGTLLPWRDGIDLLEGSADAEAKAARSLLAHEQMYLGFQPGGSLPRMRARPPKQNRRWAAGEEPGCQRPGYHQRPLVIWTAPFRRCRGKRRGRYLGEERPRPEAR